ncbi:MAG: phage portal protein [Edaphocola sp.]
MNAIDKIIGYFAPKAGLVRAQHRAAMAIMERGYDAARRTAKNKGWRIIDNTGAELEEREELRRKSRNMYQNNPYAKRAHQTLKNNTVGTGILPAIADDRTKKIWKEWAESTLADFDEKLDFYGLQSLVTETMTVHGDVLVLRVRNVDKKRAPLELKILTSRFLDRSRDTPKGASGGWVIGGIQFAANGKREGYWIYDQDPSNSYAKGVFWKKEDVIHLYEVLEPGQAMGIPLGVSSILSLRDYDDYAAAQLMRQKIAACFSVFITENDTVAAPSGVQENHLERVEPGIIEHLPPGKSVTFASPPPAEGYAEYSRNVLTGIASGFGTTYEAMTGDLSNVNFSSGRMGWLEFNRTIESLQWFVLIPRFCKVVYAWFVEAAVMAQLLPPGTPTVCEWTAPRRQMIDPVKETNGLLAQVRAGFVSWPEAVRQLGYTPEEIIEEMKAAAKMFDDAGLKPESDPRFDADKQPEKETNDNAED